ncbi:DUF4394 domain-containing protein [soil metagenome]
MKRIFLSIIAALALLPAIASADIVFGLTSGGSIFSFDSSSPATINNLVLVIGTGSDTLVDIDFYPVTGALYGFASSGNLYRIDPFTGVATLDVSPQMSVGTVLRTDFNPVADRARLISANNENYRITPSVQTPGPANPGFVSNDGNFSFAAGSGTGTPNLQGAAYTNNFDGTTSTQLYTVDLNNLYLNTNAPGAPAGSFGLLNLVGSLGITLDAGFVGFDISQSSGTAFLSNNDFLYTVNLQTGAATFVGLIGGALGADTISIAAVAIPEPSTYALLALGAAGVFAARRRARRSSSC